MIPQDFSQNIVGYDLDSLLGILFSGHPMEADMSHEFKTFLFMSAEKSSKRLGSDLFGRYLNALVKSPQVWFRLRDCDALARYTIVSALVCNDFNDLSFSESQWQLLAEMADTLYDDVAYYKQRAEGETDSTFGYVGDEARVESYRRCREVLWALDVAWARDPAKRCVVNFIRFFGGPIHMTTRRYRFVEDGLMIGKPETKEAVKLTRNNFKLWNKVEVTVQSLRKDHNSQIQPELFLGMSDLLENRAQKHCSRCLDAGFEKQFGGVKLCENCKEKWRSYMEGFPLRFAKAFPEIIL